VLLQLRVTVPPDRTDRVRELFESDPGTAHLAVLPGASVSPPGDLVLADVARESADGLVQALRDSASHRDGAIAITGVDAAVSSAARRARGAGPRDAADAVVWEQVVRTTDADSALSVSYLAFLTIAVLLAAIAIINDSAILTIGAMVLGPEFVPLAALAVAVVQGRAAGARRALVTLVVGFVVAIGVTAAVSLVGRGLGWFGPELLSADRPQTGFITAPDKWSLVVAVLAGIAGVLSLTSAKSGALVGVFISVTTVPAAADMAIALALGGRPRVRPAATQLGINLIGIMVAATATLLVQRLVWRRVPGALPGRTPSGADHPPGRGSHAGEEDHARVTAPPIGPHRPPRRPPAGLLLIGVAIVLTGLNLRTAVTSIGPVLQEIQDGLASPAGWPAWSPRCRCSASPPSASPAPGLSARFRDSHVLSGALATMAAGLVVPRRRTRLLAVPARHRAGDGRRRAGQRAPAEPREALLPRLGPA
jgi:uncharacterized hydrophobic protein (TIGR00271 family)